MFKKHVGFKMLVVAAILGALLLSGFSAAMNAAPVSAQNTDGVLRIAIEHDMPNYNYFDLGSNTVWKADVIGWSFESLMGMDRDGSAYPLLAQSVSFDPSTLTATIYLRHNITFQDGTPMTAKDVIFSYCALRQDTTISGPTFAVPFDDNSDGTISLQEIKDHVKYVNDYEVQISARQPYNYFFLGTLGVPIIPEHIWKSHLVSVNGGNTTVDSEGYTAGIVDVTWNSDPRATIGTGPWMYVGGVRDSYRVVKQYSGYWGKNFRTPDGYSLWSENVSKMVFYVYSDSNMALNALENGNLDYIAWDVGAGSVPILKQYPNIRLHYMADNGYFYLAFNEKTRPANYIAFRHAISHIIDKKTAVQDYLGGFGQAGDSPEPPFFTAWYNSSVQHYPYDLNTAKDILDGNKVVADNGFVEQDPAWGERFPVGPNGWRTLPDGTPMQPISLFAPPADYDAVRIKVAQSIAQNMRALGINTQATPVDFDTLVAYMNSYKYQMLELGWALSSDPIGNLADILGPHSIQNTYGWWNASNPNPYYVNAGGVNNTRADKMSQDYATQFEKVINTAMTTFNMTKQIKYAKWAQGIETKATVVNVLYYRLNVLATRTSWTGWVAWQGSLLNEFSLSMLKHSGAGNPNINALLNVPSTVSVGSNITGMVSVVNAAGEPISNATVSINVSDSNVVVQPATGRTNSAGQFEFTLTGASVGAAVLEVSVSKNGDTTVSTATVNVIGIPKVLRISATPTKYVLQPGENDTVYVHVEDQDGNSVSGANVTVDPEVVGYGTITPQYALTDSNGVATFTYTAPSSADFSSKYQTMHTISDLVFTATKPGYAYSNTLALHIPTYNDAMANWIIYRVVNATKYVVSPTEGWNISVTVKAINALGEGVANAAIYVNYSNSAYVNGAVTQVVTNSTGYATFSVQFNPGLPTAPVYITFNNAASIMTVSDRLDILYYNGTGNAANLFGGYISFSSSLINDSAEFTLHMYNVTNQPAASGANETIPMAIVVSGTVDGQLVDLDDETNNGGWYFNSGWYYTGIGIYTPHDSIATSGDFIGYANRTPNPYDNGLSTWNETGVEPALLHNGTLTIGLPLNHLSYRDLKFNVYAVPYGEVYLYISDPEWDFYQFNITGQQVFGSQAIVSRATDLYVASVSTNATVLSGEHFQVKVTVHNKTNAPVSNVGVKVYNNIKSWKAVFPAVTGNTDTSGVAVLSPQAPKKSVPEEIMVYAKPIAISKAYGISEYTEIVVVPSTGVSLAANLEKTVLSKEGDNLTVLVKLQSSNISQVANKSISVSVGGVNYNLKTNNLGMGSLSISAANFSGSVPVLVQYSSSGAWTVEYSLEAYVIPEIMKMGTVNYPTIIMLGSSGNISVAINSTYNLTSVKICITGENGTYFEANMTHIAGTNIYYYNKTYLSAGNYTFYIEATDVLGTNATSQTYAFEVVNSVPEFNSFAVIAIVAIALFGLLWRKRETL